MQESGQLLIDPTDPTEATKVNKRVQVEIMRPHRSTQASVDYDGQKRR
jgi:hypothetical protein